MRYDIKRIKKFLLHDRRYLIKQIKNRIFAKLFYRFLQGRSFFLNDVTILLTYRCNLGCVMCPQHGRYGLVSREDTGDECEVPLLKKFIDEVRILKPSIITLSGGEPFLYKGWYDVANYIREKNIKVCLITNGTLLDKFLDEITNSIDILHISLDGLENTHNRIRGSDVFENVINNIKSLQKKSKKPQIAIAYTFSKDNFFSLKEFIHYFTEENIVVEKFIFQHLLFLSDNLYQKHKEVFIREFNIHSDFWSGFLFEPEDINTDLFLQEVSDVKKEFTNVIFKPDFKTYELKKYYEDKDHIPHSYKRCLSPYLSLTLLPSGDLWICPSFSIGNIKEDRIIDIWNGRRAIHFRKFLQKIKLFPACRSCCQLYEY